MKFEKLTSINIDISQQELKVLTSLHSMLKEFGESDALMIFDYIVCKEPVIRTSNSTIRVRYDENDDSTIDIRSPSKSKITEEKPKERNLDLLCKISTKYFASRANITYLHKCGFKVARDFIGHKREDIKKLKSPRGLSEATMHQIDIFLYDNGIILGENGVYIKDKNVHKPVDISPKKGLELTVNPDGTVESIKEV